MTSGQQHRPAPQLELPAPQNRRPPLIMNALVLLLVLSAPAIAAGNAKTYNNRHASLRRNSHHLQNEYRPYDSSTWRTADTREHKRPDPYRGLRVDEPEQLRDERDRPPDVEEIVVDPRQYTRRHEPDEAANRNREELSTEFEYAELPAELMTADGTNRDNGEIPKNYDPDETDPYATNVAEEIAQQSIVHQEIRSEESVEMNYESTTTSPQSSKRSAWIAHGIVALLTFGLIVPTAISAALFRDFLPAYWIYIHVFFNLSTFLLSFIAVCMAITTMNSLGDKNEGHLKELHHIAGLLLLLLVSFQTANGFLRPPREFVTDDEEDSTPGAIHSSVWESQKFTPRTLWQLVHRCVGIVIFALGTWQVRSGLAIYARKFSTADYGGVYLGYIGWLVLVIGGAKFYMNIQERKKEEKGGDWNGGDELYDTDVLSQGRGER
jgi:hypothetical protein